MFDPEPESRTFVTCSHVKSQKTGESISIGDSIHLRLSNSERDLTGLRMIIFRLNPLVWKIFFQQQTRFVCLETLGLCCAGLIKQMFLSVCSKRLFDSHAPPSHLLHPRSAYSLVIGWTLTEIVGRMATLLAHIFFFF